MDSMVEPPPAGRVTAREVAEWWYGPVATPEPWVATGYLLVSALASLAWFVVGIVVAALAIPLVVIVVGIPLVTAMLAGLVRLGAVERRRAGWVDAPIPEAAMVRGSGWLDWRSRFTDPVRWRALAHTLTAPVVFSVLLAATIAGWGASLYLIAFPLWGWAVGVGPVGLVVSVLAGVALIGVGPRAALLFGRLGARYTAWLLGPDRVVAMQERVDELSANRDEILSAVASERRRIERNLHDGVQQHLVAIGIDLGLAAAKLESDPGAARELLREAQDKNRASIGELRSIGRGLHPAVLDDRGLDAALSAVVAGSPVPIALEVQPGLELPIDTAETAYFVVSEAVANVLKHARARTASVRISDDGASTTIVVHDDGRGGADERRGTGIAGMAARVRGADGSFELVSPKGGPTVVTVGLPHG